MDKRNTIYIAVLVFVSVLWMSSFFVSGAKLFSPFGNTVDQKRRPEENLIVVFVPVESRENQFKTTGTIDHATVNREHVQRCGLNKSDQNDEPARETSNPIRLLEEFGTASD